MSLESELTNTIPTELIAETTNKENKDKKEEKEKK